MIDKSSRFDLNAKDVDLIEAALETQSKILSLQANAGGSGARLRLNNVKRVLAKIEAQRPVSRKPCKKPGWLGLLGFAT